MKKGENIENIKTFIHLYGHLGKWQKLKFYEQVNIPSMNYFNLQHDDFYSHPFKMKLS